MGGFVPNTPQDRQKMLQSMGCSSVDDLYCDVPASMRVKELDLAPGMSEMEALGAMEAMAAKNTRFRSVFRGAGSYDHYIPAIVRRVTSKEEFVTAYTPYQAEISQGVLQSVFEYQTMICGLTGMDVSNASVYDGATAAAEAVMMCRDRRREAAVVSGAVNPQTLGVLRTYCASRSVTLTVVPAKNGRTDADAMRAAMDGSTACLLFQQPNFFGMLEDCEALCALAHEGGAKAVMAFEPISLGVLKTPGECGADIAVGEGQPLGLPMGFGGPYLGIMAASAAMMRKLPGRIVGATADAAGRRAYVLTLQAREQHIRREKASSNICSNEALCAMTAAVYLAAVGPQGLQKCAESCYANAHYAAEQLCAVPGFSLRWEDEFFNEFVTSCPVDAETLNRRLSAKGILGGLPVEGGLLWCATEKQSRAQIDELAAAVKEACAE